MQGKKQYTEKLFTTFRLSERIPEDNLYRQLRDNLDLEFVYDLTKDVYGTTGSPSIDPKVFFKFVLVGHLEGIASDRKLIDHCSLRMDILFFLGYDIDEDLPWHSTISRTRQLYTRELFEEVFNRIFSMCVEAGLVDGATQAIDSTISKANASKDSLIDHNPEDDHTHSNTHTGGKGQVNSKRKSTTDDDARLAHRPGKGTTLGYLTNVVVDKAHHVITHIQPDLADKRDSECLQNLVEEVKQRLAKHDLIPQNILADTNYSSGPNYAWLEQQGLTGWIPAHGAHDPDKKDLTYEPQTDSFLCQAGHKLTPKSRRFNKRGNVEKLYTISATICKACPLKSVCLPGKSRYKKIKTSAYHTFFRRAQQRQQTPTGILMKKLRSSRVEPVIGTLVNQYGIRKFRFRGLGANVKELFMAAAAYNLKKLMTNRPDPTRKLHAMTKGIIKAQNELIKAVTGAFLAVFTTPNEIPYKTTITV